MTDFAAMPGIPDDIMVEALETIFRSEAKFEFAGTEQIEILARDIGRAILAERLQCANVVSTYHRANGMKNSDCKRI
jgi:hypothetical protein